MGYNQSYDSLLKTVARHKDFTVGEANCLNQNLQNFRMYRILLTADRRCHLANSLILEILIQTKALWKTIPQTIASDFGHQTSDFILSANLSPEVYSFLTK